MSARAAADPLATFDLPLPGPVVARLAGTAAARLPDEYGTPYYLLPSLLVEPPVSDADISRMLGAGAGHVPVGETMFACACCTGRPVFPHTDTGYPVTIVSAADFCSPSGGLGHSARSARFLRLSDAQLAPYTAEPEKASWPLTAAGGRSSLAKLELPRHNPIEQPPPPESPKLAPSA